MLKCGSSTAHRPIEVIKVSAQFSRANCWPLIKRRELNSREHSSWFEANSYGSCGLTLSCARKA